ncbi:MAG: hypothetical protein CXR30_04475 [Geobacter sp.]|nr:MAG: hypothetical protein CXR30_04475 [Geobacter sp.]
MKTISNEFEPSLIQMAMQKRNHIKNRQKCINIVQNSNDLAAIYWRRRAYIWLQVPFCLLLRLSF